MFFTRTYKYSSAKSADDIKHSLLGKHVRIHNLDFEIFERDSVLRIIPHAEQETNVKTLPITNIELSGEGDKTHVVISSKMRKIDSGGPMLILVFCLFMLTGAALFFMVGDSEYISYTYTMLGASILIFAIFWLRMERGYFDYIRKIRDYVKTESAVR
ncbi:MAG: hypothetical protein JNL72_08180 [Flavipsychrobacter sp.]|nr:hypothetical protein [Flavipsychrobacter sp.]